MAAGTRPLRGGTRAIRTARPGPGAPGTSRAAIVPARPRRPGTAGRTTPARRAARHTSPVRSWRTAGIDPVDEEAAGLGAERHHDGDDVADAGGRGAGEHEDLRRRLLGRSGRVDGGDLTRPPAIG